MIILDTNIISEMMKKKPFVNVINWLDLQNTAQLFITTITIAEISYGINALTEKHRQYLLQEAFDKIISEIFKYRILSFNDSAAFLYGEIMGHRKKIGKPLSILDGQIAAIARANKNRIATRNIKDFKDCGVELINPFE